MACINDLLRAAIQSNDHNGRWGYLAPLFNQAKDVAWDYLKRFSEPVRTGLPNESELRVDLFNGNRIRLYGADNPERLRGGYFNGIILDEYADMRPSVWGEVIRPALADKKGWATFIGTPRGRVGLYDIWTGKNQWKGVELYRLMLKASETGILTSAELADMTLTMTEEEREQELECSFEAAIRGAVYGKLMGAAESDKRVCSVPYDPSALVYTAWDLGIGDPTAIWFFQTIGREIRLIDYYEASGSDIAHYAAVLKARAYNYGGHILPHDAKPRELGSGMSIREILENLGVTPLHVLPDSRVEDGINAARLKIPMCYFDAKKCERGIEALKLYRYEWDDKLATLRNTPVHDWTSHAADAFRYLAMGLGRLPDNNFNRKINYPKSGII